MRTRTIIAAICCSWMSITASAQSVAEQMNEVKDNPAYCYGEGADEDPEKAADIALDDLCTQLAKKNVTVDKARLQKKAKKLERQRGSQTRTLMYVTLSDFQGTSSASGNPAQTTQTVSQPVNQPANPSQNQTTSQVTQSSQQGYVTTNTTVTTVTNYNDQSNSGTADSKMSRIINQMKVVKHLDTLKWFLTEAKEDGLILNYGPSSKVTDSDNVYWWVFTKGETMEFVAVLSPVKANGKRENLVTGEEKAISDFQDCGFVWFTLP